MRIPLSHNLNVVGVCMYVCLCLSLVWCYAVCFCKPTERLCQPLWWQHVIVPRQNPFKDFVHMQARSLRYTSTKNRQQYKFVFKAHSLKLRLLFNCVFFKTSYLDF